MFQTTFLWHPATVIDSGRPSEVSQRFLYFFSEPVERLFAEEVQEQ